MTDLSINDTGLDLQGLQRQDNYGRWARDFKMIAAELKGVWELYTGEEILLTKPDRLTYGIKPMVHRIGNADLIYMVTRACLRRICPQGQHDSILCPVRTTEYYGTLNIGCHQKSTSGLPKQIG